MRYSQRPDYSEFHPRLIVWRLTPGDGATNGGTGLTQNERFLVLEGIARTAKTIVVFTGDRLVRLDGLVELIQYGVALGLKIIIEAAPSDLTQEIVLRFSSFGPKIFRVILDGAVAPGAETRFEESEQYRELESTIRLLRSAGCEIHLSAMITQPDIRLLAVQHDYAFRRSANGFYCHLAIPDGEGESAEGEDEIDRYIDAVANLKQFCPSNMYYLSPQCIKYGYQDVGEENGEYAPMREDGHTQEWRHWCLGGRSFAYISHDGIVKVCAQLPIADGDLKKAGFDFRHIWESSETFRMLRAQIHSCTETRELLTPAPVHKQRTRRA